MLKAGARIRVDVAWRRRAKNDGGVFAECPDAEGAKGLGLLTNNASCCQIQFQKKGLYNVVY